MTKDGDKPLPPGEYRMNQFKAIRPLAKVLGMFSKEVRDSFRDVENQYAALEQMLAERDEFACRYASLGWVYYDRLSTELVAKVIGQNTPDGENELVRFHLSPDTLKFLGYRFKAPHYLHWQEIFDRAHERLQAQDFISAIPLALIIIDGICTTSSGKHPFSGGADAPVFDTQTSGTGGLSEGLALLGSTRRKLDTDPISIPYRHGIVHGLNPNFGNEVVAAKTLNLLQATVDYFDRKRTEDDRLSQAKEDQRVPSWIEMSKSLVSNAQTRKELEEWRARPEIEGTIIAASDRRNELEKGSPEAYAADYLDLLMARNFGGLAKLTLDFVDRTVGYRAGILRDDLEGIQLTNWKITGVTDEAPAISEVTVDLSGTYNDHDWTTTHSMRMVYTDSAFETLVRGHEGGQWSVMPLFVRNLLPSILSDNR